MNLKYSVMVTMFLVIQCKTRELPQISSAPRGSPYYKTANCSDPELSSFGQVSLHKKPPPENLQLTAPKVMDWTIQDESVGKILKIRCHVPGSCDFLLWGRCSQGTNGDCTPTHWSESYDFQIPLLNSTKDGNLLKAKGCYANDLTHELLCGDERLVYKAQKSLNLADHSPSTLETSLSELLNLKRDLLEQSKTLSKNAKNYYSGVRALDQDSFTPREETTVQVLSSTTYNLQSLGAYNLAFFYEQNFASLKQSFQNDTSAPSLHLAENGCMVRSAPTSQDSPPSTQDAVSEPRTSPLQNSTSSSTQSTSSKDSKATTKDSPPPTPGSPPVVSNPPKDDNTAFKAITITLGVGSIAWGLYKSKVAFDGGIRNHKAVQFKWLIGGTILTILGAHMLTNSPVETLNRTFNESLTASGQQITPLIQKIHRLQSQLNF